MKKRYLVISILIFLFILTGFRILWMNYFQQSNNYEAVAGKLDLKEWQTENSDILLLNGEWEFFPNEFIMDKNNQPPAAGEFVQVPQGWNDQLGGPYGYGSYRLVLQFDPNIEENLSIFFPSVRSSSEIYINGKKLSSTGEIGRSKAEYRAENVPPINLLSDK